MTTDSFYHRTCVLFSDASELAVLEQATFSLAEGRPRDLALFGLRRIGKTLLLMEHLHDCWRKHRQAPSGRVCGHGRTGKVARIIQPALRGPGDVLGLDRWAGRSLDFLDANRPSGWTGCGLALCRPDHGPLESARDDPALQVSVALDFPEKLAAELGCYLLLLDEFTELAVLGNTRRCAGRYNCSGRRCNARDAWGMSWRPQRSAPCSTWFRMVSHRSFRNSSR